MHLGRNWMFLPLRHTRPVIGRARDFPGRPRLGAPESHIAGSAQPWDSFGMDRRYYVEFDDSSQLSFEDACG
jgi:hypothetical protein